MDYNYHEKDGKFVDEEGNPITNGTFKAIQRNTIIYSTKKTRTVGVEFIAGTEKEIVKIPFDVLNNSKNSNKLFQCIPDYFFFYKDIGKFKENYIRNRILPNLENLPINEFYALEQGDNIIKDKHIFCIGDCIVNPSNDTKYISLSNKKLKPSTDEKKYLEWICKFCNLDIDNMPVLLLSVIVAIIRPLLKEAGINDLFVTYIYGETGKGKSTYSKLLTEIYDNERNYLTLSSDITGLRELMLQIKDFVVLADDLNISSSSRIKASKESKISEIIQQAANGDKVTYKKEKSYFEGLLFVTAEYVLNSHSTINRCVLVNIAKDINTDTLNYLKEHYGLYIEFIKDFIKYIYNNFDNNVEQIKDYNIPVQKNNSDDAFAGIMRIKQTEKKLKIALKIIIIFFQKELLLDKYITDKMEKIFQNSIINCIKNTKKYVRKENAEAGTEYIDKIIELLPTISDNPYDDLFGQPHYAGNYTDYIQRKMVGNPCYLFQDNNCICFTGDDIVNYFKTLSDFDYSITKQAISTQLRYHGLLKCKSGEYSFPCKSAKSKERYYHIDIKSLAEFIYPGEDNIKSRKKFIKSLKE